MWCVFARSQYLNLTKKSSSGDVDSPWGLSPRPLSEMCDVETWVHLSSRRQVRVHRKLLCLWQLWPGLAVEEKKNLIFFNLKNRRLKFSSLLFFPYCIIGYFSTESDRPTDVVSRSRDEQGSAALLHRTSKVLWTRTIKNKNACGWEPHGSGHLGSRHCSRAAGGS